MCLRFLRMKVSKPMTCTSAVEEKEEERGPSIRRIKRRSVSHSRTILLHHTPQRTIGSYSFQDAHHPRAMDNVGVLLGMAFFLAVAPAGLECVYYGVLVDTLTSPSKVVSGVVHAATEDAFYLEDFTYDGSAEAHFWVTNKPVPDDTGTALPDENGATGKLGKYTKKTILISLAAGKKIMDYKSFAVWDTKTKASLGAVEIKTTFRPPAEQTMTGFPDSTTLPGAAMSDEIILKDSKTVQLKGFTYDTAKANCPAGGGRIMVSSTSPSAYDATKVLKDNAMEFVLKDSAKKDYTLMLPDTIDLGDVSYISVFCKAPAVSITEVQLPTQKTFPAKKPTLVTTTTTTTTTMAPKPAPAPPPPKPAPKPKKDAEIGNPASLLLVVVAALIAILWDMATPYAALAELSGTGDGEGAEPQEGSVVLLREGSSSEEETP